LQFAVNLNIESEFSDYNLQELFEQLIVMAANRNEMREDMAAAFNVMFPGLGMQNDLTITGNTVEQGLTNIGKVL
jgi:hypothetical protein